MHNLPPKKATHIFLPITSDISKSPDCLLADVLLGWGDQADEGRDGPAIHHGGRLIRRPRGYVGQRPGRLELNRRAIGEGEEGHKLGDEAGSNHLVDGRVFVTGQQLPAPETLQLKKKKTKNKTFACSFILINYRAAWVACSWDSRLSLFTPATISSTVHGLIAWTGKEKQRINRQEVFSHTQHFISRDQNKYQKNSAWSCMLLAS